MDPSLDLTGWTLERKSSIDNLLVRIHFIILMIWWTGLAPWEFAFPFSGSLTSTFLGVVDPTPTPPPGTTWGGALLPGAVHYTSNRGTQFEDNYFTEIWSGSEAGSYLRRIDCVYHSALGLRVIKRNHETRTP